jgi:predicted component of type VI protein secretion system
MSLFDIEEAENVAREKRSRKASPGVRFVLKFSQGLSVTVSERAGIIGVKPEVEGEEIFRVSLVDETDTVAPEHIEFGVENGVFWVKDLRTMTGTVVEEPGAPAIQCIPYESYSLVRGSQVRLGDISFTLH